MSRSAAVAERPPQGDQAPKLTPQRPRARPYWQLTIALIALSATSNLALDDLLRGSGWWWLMTIVAAIVLVSAALFRRLGLNRVTAPLATFGVFIVTLTLFFGAGTGLLWLIPMPGTFARFGELIDIGTNSIVQQSTPAEPIDGIVFLLACGAGLLAIAMDVVTISFRVPALAGLAALVTVLIPGFITEEGANIPVLVLTACAYLVLLRIDVRIRRFAGMPRTTTPTSQRQTATAAPQVTVARTRTPPGPIWSAVSVGAIAVTAALVLTISTPPLSSGDVASSRGSGLLFGAGVSPMIDLGQDLRRPKSTKALHYSTTADSPPYLKLLTLDTLEGAIWTSSDGTEGGNSLAFIDTPEGLADDVDRTESSTSITIDNVRTTWLPSPVPATSVSGLDSNWTWLNGNQTIVGADPTARGQTYNVTALQLHPTEGQLRSSSTDYPPNIQFTLALPEDIPEIVSTTAREVTSGSASPYDSALAIQDYLRSSLFTYDTQSPVESGYDGGSLDVIAAFLDVKRGYCVHFASAMAVMARDIGIPARIAVGYLPGGRVTDVTQGYGQYVVDSHDLHSWPELYFPGVGWLAFEPTPGRGSVPDYAQPQQDSTANPSQAPVQPTNAPAQNEIKERADSGGVAAGDTGASEQGYAARGTIALVALLCVLLIPALIRRARRRIRLVKIRTGRARQSVAWTEIADTLRDHGIDVREASTLRERASHLCAVLGAPWPPERAGNESPVTAAVDRLLVAEELLRYSQSQQHPSGRPVDVSKQVSEDLTLLIRAIEAGAAPAERARALFAPASLWPTGLGWRNKRRAGA
ncbi:transglutaminaseTgpA domain-containing protein [Leifsonia sp. A12D58]|uniref:transglutaminase family protein n=1 Tax=Leifsonia sp. A12D58 TaxID=3397674 RepID=UPI0039E008B0